MRSMRNVLTNWSRNIGMPYSSSASVGLGEERWATFSPQRSISSARLSVRNSWSTVVAPGYCLNSILSWAHALCSEAHSSPPARASAVQPASTVVRYPSLVFM